MDMMCRRCGPTWVYWTGAYYHRPCFDKETLDVVSVHFDVSVAALLPGGDSVCVVSRLMMSDDTGDKN